MLFLNANDSLFNRHSFSSSRIIVLLKFSRVVNSFRLFNFQGTHRLLFLAFFYPALSDSLIIISQSFRFVNPFFEFFSKKFFVIFLLAFPASAGQLVYYIITALFCQLLFSLFLPFLPFYPFYPSFFIPYWMFLTICPLMR